LLHSVLGIKMKSPFVPTVIPTYSEPIVPYTQRMAAMMKGDGIASLRKWRVTRTRAYKSRASARHEYISATVVDSENKISYIAIERHRGDPIAIHPSDNTDIDPQPAGSFSNSNPSISSISSVSDSSPTRFADDKIAPIPNSTGKWDKNDDLIYELNFEKPLYLYELALLAMTVHQENTSYLLTTNNCYHYAGTIMKVLEEKYKIVNTADGVCGGKWCGLVIYPGKKEGNSSSLVEKFREAIKNFESLSVSLEARTGDVSARNEDLEVENALLRERLAEMTK